MTLFINPVDAARIFAVLTLEPDMYILGPSGAYMVDTFSVVGTGALLLASMLLWTVLPFFAAARMFSRRLLYPGRKRSFFRMTTATAAMLGLLLTSCGGDGKKEEAAESNEAEQSEAPALAEDEYRADPANLTRGTELYMSNCAPCHGKAGKGDGPAAANLNPKPRDHSNGEYMAKLTDKHIGNVIKKGGSIAGFPTMPAHPHLKQDDINAILAFVRTLGKK